MQISFSQYFKSFDQWLYPVYWVSGEGDGRMDIEQRLVNSNNQPQQTTKRLICKKKDDLELIKQHFCVNDLFNDPPLLLVNVAGLASNELADWLMSNTLKNNQKIIVWSPKLTPKLKKHGLWSQSWVGHYALWPYSREQALVWWQKSCERLHLKPSGQVTQSILIQAGYRIDELVSILSVWQLQYPEGGVVNDVPEGSHQLSDRVYDEVYAWLAGGDIKSGLSMNQQMPFYFALKQTLDEIVQYQYKIQCGVQIGELTKQLGWWPQKTRQISMLAKKYDLSYWLKQIWLVSYIDMARVGAGIHSFEDLLNCYYRRQTLPLDCIR
jgi:hypothetical protein